MSYFIHQEIRITDNNSYRGSFNRNKQNFKNKNYNKKVNPLNNKVEISRFNFCGFQMLLKNIMIYDYMNN